MSIPRENQQKLGVQEACGQNPSAGFWRAQTRLMFMIHDACSCPVLVLGGHLGGVIEEDRLPFLVLGESYTSLGGNDADDAPRNQTITAPAV